MDLNRLDIRNIEQYNMHARRIDIACMIDGKDYDLVVFKEKDEHVFFPKYVYHRFYSKCSLCDESEHLTHCVPLEEVKLTLFHRLIEHASIRLEWLFIPHSNESNQPGERI